MAFTVKKIILWCKQVDDKPGGLATALAPLADAGADLEVVMGTAMPGDAGRATVGVFPLQGRKAIAAAKAAGFGVASSMPALLVVGDDSQGLGSKIAQDIADAGINIGFVIALRIDRNFAAVFGFQDGDAASTATRLIRRLALRQEKRVQSPSSPSPTPTRPRSGARTTRKKAAKGA